MNNNKKHKVSPSFIVFLIVIACIALYGSYYLVKKTLLPLATIEKQPTEISLDSNQVELNTKDSIIAAREMEISKLRQELFEKPDTVFVKPKVGIAKKIDTISSISKLDSMVK